MEQYVKAVLYAYPLLDAVEEDYGVHIRNKAVLSCLSEDSAEKIAEYIAGEILQKRKFEWMKECVRSVIEKLSAAEKTLLAIRYFGKEKKIKRVRSTLERENWSDRKYFRLQNRLGEKVGGMLAATGLTKEVFEREFASFELFGKIYAFVRQGKDAKVRESEKQWIRM